MRRTTRSIIIAATTLTVAAALAGCSGGAGTSSPAPATTHTDATVHITTGGDSKISVVQVAKTTSSSTTGAVCVIGVQFTAAGSEPQDPGRYLVSFLKAGTGTLTGPVSGAKAVGEGRYAMLDGWPVSYDGENWYYSGGKLVEGAPNNLNLAAGKTGRVAYAAKCSDLSPTAKIEDATADPTVYKTFDATWK